MTMAITTEGGDITLYVIKQNDFSWCIKQIDNNKGVQQQLHNGTFLPRPKRTEDGQQRREAMRSRACVQS